MKKYQTITILVLFLTFLAGGCASVTKDIEIDATADPTIKFSGYKSYGWLAEISGLNDPDGVWQPPKMDIAEDIKYLIDRELGKRGIYSYAENPDLAVAFFMGVDMEALELKTDPKTKQDIMSKVPSAALAVALIDANTGYVVWVGEAIGEIQKNPSDELIRKRLDYAVSEIFKKLPSD
ncbi:DUF4136 domain-containing protein [Methylomonas sp. MgM2]